MNKKKKSAKGKDKSSKKGKVQEKEKTAAKPKKEVNDKKAKRPRVVRDSFTMPEHDYARIKMLKAEFMKLGVNMKKGEVLRAGLYALEQMSEQQRQEIQKLVDPIKTGRPKK